MSSSEGKRRSQQGETAMLRKLTKFEVKSLISDCPAKDYALKVLFEETSPPLPPARVDSEVVSKVEDCARQWMKGQVLDEQLDKAIVGFAFVTMRYPEHPAFDSIRDSVSDKDISGALQVIANRYACKISPCVVKGATVYVVAKGEPPHIFEPLYLATLGKLEPRIKDIGLKVLGDCLRAICMISTGQKRIPQHQHWAIARMIWDLYNYKIDFYYIRN
jgi:hypothetical protein